MFLIPFLLLTDLNRYEQPQYPLQNSYRENCENLRICFMPELYFDKHLNPRNRPKNYHWCE